MLRFLYFILGLLSFQSYGQSIRIQLPENPIIDSIPSEWRGYNEGAKSLISEIKTEEFSTAFNQLDPGIIRWPGGNSGNNYLWQNHLNDNGRLNLKNIVPFLDHFGVELQVVVNFGNGSASEAATFVNICNNTSPYYTHIRDSLLHTNKPLDVKYWEIGNESTDAWSFGWSWLGFQENIHFHTGIPDKIFTRIEADSMYYYGGSLFREGWVNAIGGLDNNTAILGDLKFYSNIQFKDTIAVEYPLLDIEDPNAVRVYRTHNFNISWAHQSASQQALYDSITKPNNLLKEEEFTWTPKHVMLTPNGGFQSNDIILIEYNSTGHDGAFSFRDAMKTADPTIQIGYTVRLEQEQADNPVFQKDFAKSPPDFMIKHPYASGLTIPAVEHGLFSDAAYVSEKKLLSFATIQQQWNQRVLDWQIPNEIGLSLTEWNIALFDDAPNNHPIRGITCGLYIADFWARSFTYGLNDTFDLRTMNHFALSAQGNNFIHLLHPNENFTVGTEGIATTMVMQSIGRGMFPISIEENPQIEVLTNNGQLLDTVIIDALQVWAGIGMQEEQINLLIINRDDENDQIVDINIPSKWHADSVTVHLLKGTMVDENVFYTINNESLLSTNYQLELPNFSVNTIHIHLSKPLNTIDLNAINGTNYIYPNPSNHTISLNTFEKISLINIFNNIGQKVYGQNTFDSDNIDISNLKKGSYYLQVSFENNTSATYQFIKQ